METFEKGRAKRTTDCQTDRASERADDVLNRLANSQQTCVCYYGARPAGQGTEELSPADRQKKGVIS